MPMASMTWSTSATLGAAIRAIRSKGPLTDCSSRTAGRPRTTWTTAADCFGATVIIT